MNNMKTALRTATIKMSYDDDTGDATDALVQNTDVNLIDEPAPAVPAEPVKENTRPYKNRETILEKAGSGSTPYTVAQRGSVTVDFARNADNTVDLEFDLSLDVTDKLTAGTTTANGGWFRVCTKEFT